MSEPFNYPGASVSTEIVHVVSPTGTLPDTTYKAAEAALNLRERVKEKGESVVLQVRPYGFDDIRIPVTDRHKEPEDLMRAVNKAIRAQDSQNDPLSFNR